MPVAARVKETVDLGIVGCPSLASIRDAVAVHMGYDPFREPATEVIEIQIGRRSKGLTARLALSDLAGNLQGERTLGSGATDCQDLTEALVLAISIALDPLGTGGRPPLTSAEGLAPASRPVAADGSDEEPDDKGDPESISAHNPTRSTPDFVLDLAVGGVLDSAPSPTASLVLGGELRWLHASVALEGRADLPAGVQVSEGSIRTALVLVQLVPCLRAGWFGGCLVAQGGVETAQARNLPAATVGLGAYSALGARALGELPVGASNLSLRLAADLLAPFTRSHVLVGSDSVFTTPAIAGALSMGAAYRFR